MQSIAFLPAIGQRDYNETMKSWTKSQMTSKKPIILLQQKAKYCLIRASWRNSKHIPVDFIYIFLPLSVDSPRTVKFRLIFRYQTFCLHSTNRNSNNKRLAKHIEINTFTTYYNHIKLYANGNHEVTSWRLTEFSKFS